VDNLQKSDEVKEKKRRKCLQDYGVEHHAQRADVKKAITRSILKRHGVTNNMQRPEVRAACVKTWNRNWEHGHQLRDPDVFKRVMKSSYSRKTITLLGKTFQVQGYEPAVLKELEPRIQRLTVDPDTMPKIFYQDDTGKKRRYYPDALFQLKSGRNVLLEVKSPYTFSQPKVVQKARATFDLCSTYKDLQYWVAVHSPKGGTAWIKSRKQFDEYLPR
jgi:hypothetical protein